MAENHSILPTYYLWQRLHDNIYADAMHHY